jgi:hypothetical protein
LRRAILPGEEIDWFDSHKYDESHVRLMCSEAGLHISDVWKAPNSEFCMHGCPISLTMI